MMLRQWLVVQVCLLSLAMFCVHGAENADDNARLRADLAQLAALKIITLPDYWLENAVKGKTCEGGQVAELITSVAGYFHSAVAIEEALDCLKQRKIIWNDYWRQNAVPGMKCSGEYVANLIHVSAKELKTAAVLKRFPVPPGLIACSQPSAFAPLPGAARLDSFNYIIGTQTFGPSYQFTEKSKLVETAEAILAMGATVIKFGIAKHYAGQNGNVKVGDPGITSLTGLVRDEPAHRRVFEMPFTYYVLWTHTFSTDGWRRGLKKELLGAEYKEIYDLTCYLLRTYSGSGKSFYLGHWEGDGWLRGSVAIEKDANVTPEAARSMADWLNTRQRAVDDAKRDTPHNAVQVLHYTEVNHVWLAMEGRPALVNMVLPKTAVDLVSYSSYDTAFSAERLKAALAYIETKLAPKPGLTGRRVFIGEYGFPAEVNSPEKQDYMARQVIRAAIEWGCPLVLYWEMYNNEVENGRQRGFWLIDDKGVKQPVYHTHQQFYSWARKFVSDAVTATGQQPGYDMFRRAAVDWLSKPQ